MREGENVKSSQQAAQAVNVSPRSVENASKVLREGTPELLQAVETGQVASANEVYFCNFGFTHAVSI